MTVDQINTPPDLCNKLLGSVKNRQPASIADFASGSGELLKAAAERWGSAKIIALDIDERIVRKLRREHPHWIISQGDFLDNGSIQRSAALRNSSGGIDLILLNPPFSSRGGSRFKVMVGASVISCSRAIAFVISSLRYLRKDGELLAIVPAGSLRSEKDHHAWELLRTIFEVSLVGSNAHKTFQSYFPRTVVVRIVRRQTVKPFMPHLVKTNLSQRAPQIVLYRGSLQMHMVKNGGRSTEVPLVHSTCLRDGSVDFTQFRASNARFTISGPAVFLTRVSEPNKGKVVLYEGLATYCLSDCVIALKARKRELRVLHRKLLCSWGSLMRLYGGTGAKYVTIAEVARLLRSHGYTVRAPAGANSQLAMAIDGRPRTITAGIHEQWQSYLLEQNDGKNRSKGSEVG